MKLARYKLSRRMKFRGLDISIETDKGEFRHWYDPHNKESGKTKMKYPYGYIRRTEGTDGDHVDVYVGPNERAKNVYIVNQQKAPDFKTFDEQKCMLGFNNATEAKKAYLNHYNDSRFFGSMTTMPFEEFEKKVKKTFEEPKKIAEAPMHLKTAYNLGAQYAHTVFEKYSQENLGDPNFWAPPAEAQGQIPAGSPEEIVGLLPQGTFQGMNVRVTPDGQKSTGVKVTPEALDQPDALKALFAVEPNTRLEVTTPETPSSVTSFKETK